MQVAARRPHFGAGVALIGASVIAASAVTPMPDIHLPDVQLPSVHVADLHLAALANPLETYAQVFQAALANVNSLVENNVPGQLLNQLLANQASSAATLLGGLSSTGGQVAAAASQVPAALATAVSQLAAGNVSGAVNTLLGVPLAVASPALDLLPALQTVLVKPLENLVNVINAFTGDPLSTLLAVSGFIAPFISAPAAAAVAVQNVVNAASTGDLGAVTNAIIAAPATIADGVLNGGYGPDLGPLVGIDGLVVKAGGLLSSAGLIFNADGSFFVNTGGPLFSLQQVLQKIANAIAPQAPAPVPATAAIASIPATSATTVTLTTASAPTKAASDTSSETTAGAKETSAVATKDAAAAEPTAATTDADESGVSTKDSTTSGSTVKDETPKSSDMSTAAKPASSEVDVKTGNKVEPNAAAGSGATKSPGSSTSTAGKDAGSTTPSAVGADKGADKGPGADSKGSTS